MPRLNLTVKSISKLRAPTVSGKPELYWDTELHGFGVLCSGRTNTRSYIVQRDLPDGKTRRVTIAAVNEMALADAKDRARDLLVALRKGIDPKSKSAGTLQQTLEAYLKANKELSPRSRELYTSLVDLHLAPWKNRALSSITPAEVDILHTALAVRGPSVANDAIRAFRLLYNWASNRDDTLLRNPVRLRKNEWHKVAPQRNPIPESLLPAWYAAVIELPDMGRDYLLLLLFTGMRRREAAALSWEEVDFNQRLIRLPAARAKAGRPLDLPMSDVVRDLLVARRALGNANFVFPSYGRSGHIEGGRPWTTMVTAATGIKFTLHDLRRTFVTVAESTDLSHYALKALVNHSLGTGTTESYIKMGPERLREPVQKVADKIKALCCFPAQAMHNIK
ncbi:MAG TPA: tyrosine-type recombinase/integrase [Ktedonobacteraceae bacterium]|jgi:integrase